MTRMNMSFRKPPAYFRSIQLLQRYLTWFGANMAG